jgi:hypothetical protein
LQLSKYSLQNAYTNTLLFWLTHDTLLCINIQFSKFVTFAIGSCLNKIFCLPQIVYESAILIRLIQCLQCLCYRTITTMGIRRMRSSYVRWWRKVMIRPTQASLNCLKSSARDPLARSVSIVVPKRNGDYNIANNKHGHFWENLLHTYWLTPLCK